MGTLTYDNTLRIHLNDLYLAHLEIVIVAKLRRKEHFLFSWNRSLDDGGGRSAIWMSPDVPLGFDFDFVEVPPISRAWVQELSMTANSVGGLRIVGDPQDPETSEGIPLSQDDLT